MCVHIVYELCACTLYLVHIYIFNLYAFILLTSTIVHCTRYKLLLLYAMINFLENKVCLVYL